MFRKRGKGKAIFQFIDEVDIRKEVYLIEDWLRLDLAEKWCKRHKIEYRIDVPAAYPQKLNEREMKKSIIDKMKHTQFGESAIRF